MGCDHLPSRCIQFEDKVRSRAQVFDQAVIKEVVAPDEQHMVFRPQAGKGILPDRDNTQSEEPFYALAGTHTPDGDGALLRDMQIQTHGLFSLFTVC